MISVANLFSRISVIVFSLFTLEIILGGAGETFHVFGISIRYILFSLSVVTFFLLKLIRSGGEGHNLSNLISGFIFSCFVIVWIIFLPIVFGQGIADAFRDSAPLIGAAALVVLFDDRILSSHWTLIRAGVFFLLTLFAILHVFIYALGFLDPDAGLASSEALKYILEPTNFDVEKFVFIVPNDWGLRVYFGSSFLLLIGLYFSFFYNEKLRTVYKIILVALFLSGIVVTGTRSLILSSFVLVFIVLLMSKIKYKKGIGGVSLMILLVLPLVLVLFLILTVDSNIVTASSFSRGESDLVRPEQMEGLLNGFATSPIVGRGFGASVNPVRNIDAPYSYELSVLALYMKIGIAGIAVIIGFLTFYIHPLISRFSSKNYGGISGIYALYCSAVFASFYNPFLFGFFGTFFIIFTCLELKYLSEVNYCD